jgi:hypothetical protein
MITSGEQLTDRDAMRRLGFLAKREYFFKPLQNGSRKRGES